MRLQLCAAALACAVMASVSSADVWHHDWSGVSDCGGLGALDDYNMYVTGGDVGIGGYSQYTTTVYGPTHLEFYVDYSSVDAGQYDYFYIWINGIFYPLVYNEGQGNGLFFAFVLNPGDQVGLGVYTVDGDFGPGVSHVYNLRAWSLLGAQDMTWYPFSENGSGTVYLPPPQLQVIGGDAGFEDRTDGYFYTQPAMFALAGGNYSSGDGLNYDQGYYVSAADGYVTFIQNDTQGDFSPFFLYTQPNDFRGYGVYTTDGAFGPGVLTISYFLAYMYPGIFNDFYWYTADTAGGLVEFGDGYGVVTGGDAGVGGYTEFYGQALFDYHVEADYYYSSPDEGDYDAAYYYGRDGLVYFANNDTQGYGSLDFDVSKGDYFGFGVATSDGGFGPGTLTIYRVRCWAQPVPAGCYPDCDGSGVLDFFDFLCFTNDFNAGDPYADCDGSGILDFFDFLCFLNNFNAGC